MDAIELAVHFDALARYAFDKEGCTEVERTECLTGLGDHYDVADLSQWKEIIAYILTSAAHQDEIQKVTS